MARDLNQELQALKSEVRDLINGPEEAIEIFWNEYAQHGDRDLALEEMLACGPTAFNQALPILFPPYFIPVLDCDDLNLPPIDDADTTVGTVQSETGAQQWADLKRLREEGKYPVSIEQLNLRFPYRVPTEEEKVYKLKIEHNSGNHE